MVPPKVKVDPANAPMCVAPPPPAMVIVPLRVLLPESEATKP